MAFTKDLSFSFLAMGIIASTVTLFCPILSRRKQHMVSRI